MPNRHAKLWYELCVARTTAKNAGVEDMHNLTDEQVKLKREWERAWGKFRHALAEEGDYKRDENKDYGYTSASGEYYDPDEPL